MARFKNGNLILENDKSLVSGDESLLLYKNLLINGDFKIKQRASSYVNPSSTPQYRVFDRWQNERGGGGNTTITTSTSYPGGRGYTGSAAMTSDDVTNKNTYFWQRVEGATMTPYVGETMFVGAWVRNSISDDITIYVYSNDSGTEDTWSAENIGNTLILAESHATGDTGWHFISNTFTVTDECKDGLVVGFSCGAAATYTFRIVGARLHRGDVKIPWSILSRPPAEEVALCQRYYEKSYLLETVPGTATSTARTRWYITGAGVDIMQTHFQVSKRIAPTVTLYSPNDGSSGVCDTQLANQVAAGASSIGQYGFQINITGAVDTGILAHWAADAEL